MAALTGFATLLAMLLGYYWIGNLDGGAEIAHTFRFWLAIALVAGPVMGWAGWAWLGAIAVERVAAISILVGCLIAEGIFFWSYGHRTVPVVEVAIGVAAVFLLPRSGRERGLTVLGTGGRHRRRLRDLRDPPGHVQRPVLAGLLDLRTCQTASAAR